MVNTRKHIEHWRAGAEEDLVAAKTLVRSGSNRHALFFVHLSMEKALKALVCKVTGEIAPKTHNLIRLAALAELTLEDDQEKLLSELNVFNLEGRYPEHIGPAPSEDEAHDYLRRVEEILPWLLK